MGEDSFVKVFPSWPIPTSLQAKILDHSDVPEADEALVEFFGSLSALISSFLCVLRKCERVTNKNNQEVNRQEIRSTSGSTKPKNRKSIPLRHLHLLRLHLLFTTSLLHLKDINKSFARQVLKSVTFLAPRVCIFPTCQRAFIYDKCRKPLWNRS